MSSGLDITPNNATQDVPTIVFASMDNLGTKLAILSGRMNALFVLMIVVILAVIFALVVQIVYAVLQLMTKKIHPEPTKVIVQKEKKTDKSSKTKSSSKSFEKKSRPEKSKKAMETRQPSNSLKISVSFDKVPDGKSKKGKEKLMLDASCAKNDDVSTLPVNYQPTIYSVTGTPVSVKHEVKNKLAAPVWTTSVTEPPTVTTPPILSTPLNVSMQSAVPPSLNVPTPPPTMTFNAAPVKAPAVANLSPGTATAKENKAEVKSVSLTPAAPVSSNLKSNFLAFDSTPVSTYLQPK